MEHLHAVIIAGGSGTRFWPLSRKALPKQFLRFEKERSLLRATSERVAALVAAEWVVCGRSHARLVRRDLPTLPAAHLLCEPAAKNTAPAIALALKHVHAEDPQAIMVVLPADHFVRDPAAFRATLERAAVAAKDGGIVTLGITPQRPDTGFGYIERGAETAPGVWAVKRFVEKPPQEDAERFVAAGTYAWNGGIFVFRADTMLDLLREHAPEISQALAAYQPSDPASLDKAFAAMPSISIDYAVMEKASGVKMVALDCGWSDVGSWDALPEVESADAHGNVGELVAIDASRNIVRGAVAGKPVCLIGVDDLIVVDTPDALLVMKRGDAQRVREVVAALAEKAPDRL